MSPSVIVVGAGILGCTAALLAANRGWSVRLLDRFDSPWMGASAAGEGKVHLGLIYALGDASTQSHILEGALAFSAGLDQAVGTQLPWDELSTEAFVNVVMPTSLLNADDLSERYNEFDQRFRGSASAVGAQYLGRPLARLYEPGLFTEPLTGLPAIRVSERAVETTRLRRLIVARMRQHPRIQLVMRRDVVALYDSDDFVDVLHRDAGQPNSPVTSERADAVLNCAWESQAALHADPASAPLSIRYKASVSIPLKAIDASACRTITLVVGAYGDVVRRADDIYASWYPAGRAVSEYAAVPSDEARSLVDSLEVSGSIVDDQLEALMDLGALPRLKRGARDLLTLRGGWILAEGVPDKDAVASRFLDVDEPASTLHQRRNGMITQRGRLISPRNWKFSTAPLAAQRAVAATMAVLDGREDE